MKILSGLVLLIVGAALGVGIDRMQQHVDMSALSVGISRLQHSAWTPAPASGSDSDQTRKRQNLMASAPGSDLVLQQQRHMEALVAMDTPWTHVGKCIERNSWVGYYSLCPANGDTWELGIDGDQGNGQQWMHKDTLSQIDEDIAYKERDLKEALVSSRAWTWVGRCIERDSQVGRYAFCPLRGGSWILTVDGIGVRVHPARAWTRIH